ncbi:hypothetical protein BC835DRAFT_1269557 [Cytidiella melzeri]|nr:hypothetical protein BC835DRAFT_1269557 [Cytidiella melzeri]
MLWIVVAAVKSSWFLAALSAASLLPVAQASCFFDDFGDEHCSLDNTTRTIIAIVIVIVALIIIASALSYRRRRMRNTTFVATLPMNSQNVSYGPSYGQGHYPSGYDVHSGYYPNGPQYPPSAYAGNVHLSSPYGSNPAPPAYYAPPAGPPPPPRGFSSDRHLCRCADYSSLSCSLFLMPSIFSRSRLNSTPKRSTSEPPSDEFGRVDSRGSVNAALASSLPTKKDKKSKGKSKGNGATHEPEPQEPAVPDGSFLQLNLDPLYHRYEPGEEPAQERRQLHDYGYMSYQRHIVLGPEEVARLVDVVGNELGTRGLTTPFIFSSLALDVSANAVKRLINAFLDTCRGGRPTEAVERQWREEVQFAGPQELGMFLRWGLGRVVRIVGGQEVRGLLSYEAYVDWAESEAACNYPPMHFDMFVAELDPIIRSILVGLLTLLSKFTAHSSSSGHTPPTLSPLFGPLFFGLGPSTLAFHNVYLHYLRAVTATEHITLSFIRWQDAPGVEGSGSAALGVPTRLKTWIQGYPAMLPALHHHDRPQPRRGARTTRVISVRRNVRMYSPDLVKTAASWGVRPRGVLASSSSERSFASSKEWERISPPTLKLAPRYSDAYRKRMDLPANFHPETGAGSSASTISAPSLSSSISASSTGSSLFDDKELGVLGGARTPEDRFRSLTDLRWGEFEAMGFGDHVANNKKLQFDLTEGARAARAAKRATLSWQDFSSAGFSRNDAPLSATLQFSQPVSNTISTWPTQSAEIHRKLKKTQKALPPFGWDTEPVLGSEEVIEEAFLDVFCDMIYGGGWLDVERYEEVDRDCNWALVEFKSLPVTKMHSTSGMTDPRTAATLILFEEFVPLEYRQQLQANGASRPRLPSLFGTSSKRQWKPAQTLNGRPYVVGYVPHSPSYREAEFEGLLRSNDSGTKMLSLKTADKLPPVSVKSPSVGSPLSTVTSSPFHTQEKPSPFLTPSAALEVPVQRTSSSSSDNHDSTPLSTPNPNRRSGRFRIPGTPVGNRTAGLPPAEYENVDFEARLASFDDDEPVNTSGAKHRRQRSRDDAWVDILVANSSRRMNSQDAILRNGLKPGRSDPELASQEVSEVLAAVMSHPFSDDEDDVSEIVAVTEDGASHVSTFKEARAEPDVSTIPGRDSSLYPDDEEEEEPVFKPAQKRLGYFDLHPERRSSKPDGDASTSRVLQVSSELERPSMDSTVESAYSEPEDAYDAFVPSSSQHTLVPPKVVVESMPRSGSPLRNGHGNGHALPGVAVSPPPEEPIRTAAPQPIQSKTSSLIELYRERERNSTSPAPLSKLPVRTGSLPSGPLGARPMPTTPAGARPMPPAASMPTVSLPAQAPSLSAAPVDIDGSLPEPIPPLAHANSGLATPPRYIHGAPLHNVLEEEEEEVE